LVLFQAVDPVDLEHLTFAITTVDRQPCYLHETLASMFAAEPQLGERAVVHLVAGTNDVAYLDRYAQDERFRVHPLNDFEQEMIAPWSVPRRICHNYWRCLSLPIVEDGAICICEDDVVFRDGFLSQLFHTLDQMHAAGLGESCLALSTPFCDFSADALSSGGRTFCFYRHFFMGTQSVYFPARLVADLRDYVYECGVERHFNPCDLLTGELYADRMYACTPPLVDHIGHVSTIH
jgi:hypothetical protein